MTKDPLRIAVDSFLLIFIFGLVLRLAKPVFFPFFLALFLYFLFSPLIDLSARLKIPRFLALIFSIMIAFTILYFLGVLIYASGKALAEKLPSYGHQFNSFLDWLRGKLAELGVSYSRVAILENLNFNRLANFILASLGTFVSFLTKLLLILVFLFFMLAGRGKIKSKIFLALEPSKAQAFAQLHDQIDREIQKYLVIKTLVSFFSGAILTLILKIFGVDFALMFGILAFILNYIPSIGSIAAIILPSLYAALQFGSLLRALWIFIFLVVIDFIVANILEPKIMGQSLGLSPLAVLFFLFFWGWLWGIPGMILAVPILAIVKIVADHFPSLKLLGSLLGR
ncbi:MAG: AI-2E family transporter [Candidatus Aminicenantes bacterium]|nr:AI-2E family transporter [Candidatus Aminicenantes bacterium]